MVDGRVLYQDLDTELKGYGQVWQMLKNELFTHSEKQKTNTCCEHVHINNYELDPELQEDLDAVKGGFENYGNSAQYRNSES